MFKVSGIVKKSKGRGRELGFPTANIQVSADVEEGIFVAWVKIGSKKLPSLFFVGKALTFGESKKQGEAYILDFEGDLYGKEIEVDILKKIRENETFESAEELVVQMRDDEKRAREFFAKMDT